MIIIVRLIICIFFDLILLLQIKLKIVETIETVIVLPLRTFRKFLKLNLERIVGFDLYA